MFESHWRHKLLREKKLYMQLYCVYIKHNTVALTIATILTLFALHPYEQRKTSESYNTVTGIHFVSYEKYEHAYRSVVAILECMLTMLLPSSSPSSSLVTLVAVFIIVDSYMCTYRAHTQSHLLYHTH